MLSFAKLRNKTKTILRLTGARQEEFLKIVKKVQPLWENFQNNKKASDRSSRLKTLEDEVLMWLIYYRFYVTFPFLELRFDLDKSNIYHHVKRLKPMLAPAIKIKKSRELTQNDSETILIDATKVQIQRPKK